MIDPNTYRLHYTSLTGGTIHIHELHTGPELLENLAIATRLADLGHQVFLLPISDEPNAKNPDALIDGSIWEFKTNKVGTYLSIDTEIRRARKQADHILLWLSVPINSQELANAIYNRVRQCANVLQVALIYHNKLLILTREQIMNQSFRKLLKGEGSPT